VTVHGLKIPKSCIAGWKLLLIRASREAYLRHPTTGIVHEIFRTIRLDNPDQYHDILKRWTDRAGLPPAMGNTNVLI